MPSWKKLLQSGSSAHLHSVTASHGAVISGSITFDDGTSMSSADSVGLFVKQSDGVYIGTSSVHLSGTLSVSSSNNTDTAIFTNNVQNGYPTSNDWGTNLEGSYFNNFSPSTNVSEILRFMAGVLSSSLDVADASPNTKYWNSVTRHDDEGATGTIPGALPQNYTLISDLTTKNIFTYLVSKGFLGTGQRLFQNIDDIYFEKATTFSSSFSSNAAGSTTVRSSADNQLFSMGNFSGNATPIKVKIIATHSFSNESSVIAPTQTNNTSTTQSNYIIDVNSFTTDTEGVELAKIETNQPAVIPAAFQDGKFFRIGKDFEGTRRKNNLSDNNMSSVSASGYYRWHGMKVGIDSGSGYNFKSATSLVHFYAPIVNISSSIIDNDIQITNASASLDSALSRSLSGAPYISRASWMVYGNVTGLFNPLYSTSVAVVRPIASSDTYTINESSSLLNLNGGTVQTANTVFASNGTTVRALSTVPYYDDIVKFSSSLSSNWSNGVTNIQLNSGSYQDSTFKAVIKAKDRQDTEDQLDSRTFSYHTKGTFGQPATSGSMGILGGTQSTQASSATIAPGGTTYEYFKCEQQRIQITNNLLANNPDAWDTDFSLGDLGASDAQVKPSYLVNSGQSYRYWYPSGYGDDTQFYIRKFQYSGTVADGDRTELKIELQNANEISWTSTSDGVACAILFESSTESVYGSGNARIFDPFTFFQTEIETGISTGYKNPFGRTIDLWGNNNGSVTSGLYTVPLVDGAGMKITHTNTNFWVIVRIKGSNYTSRIRVTLD